MPQEDEKMSRTSEGKFKWWKIFRAKMMKFCRKIFFTRGLCNSPMTLLERFRDLLDNFYAVLVITFWILELIFFVKNTIKLWAISLLMHASARNFDRPCSPPALRVSPAETWFTVYRLRLVSVLNMILHVYFCDFFGVANLFWLQLFLVPSVYIYIYIKRVP